jgi:hypothetical protein
MIKSCSRLPPLGHSTGAKFYNIGRVTKIGTGREPNAFEKGILRCETETPVFAYLPSAYLDNYFTIVLCKPHYVFL